MTLLSRALVGDEGLVPTSHKGLFYPFGERGPAPGELLTIVPGLRWWRVPMSGPLKHVNGYVLDDGDGATVVDTGFNNKEAVEAWKAMLDGPLAGRQSRHGRDRRARRVRCQSRLRRHARASGDGPDHRTRHLCRHHRRPSRPVSPIVKVPHAVALV